VLGVWCVLSCAGMWPVCLWWLFPHAIAVATQSTLRFALSSAHACQSDKPFCLLTYLLTWLGFELKHPKKEPNMAHGVSQSKYTSESTSKNSSTNC